MAPWTTLNEFFDRLAGHEARAGNLREDEMRLAAAALLVHASMIDGEVAAEERRKLKILLQERFELDDDEMRRLMRESEAESRIRRSVRLHQRLARARPEGPQADRRDAVGNGDGRRRGTRVRGESGLARGRAARRLDQGSREVAEDGGSRAGIEPES